MKARQGLFSIQLVLLCILPILFITQQALLCEIKAIAEKLTQKLESEHEAQHLMMECLGQVMWESQREGKPLNPENYLEALKKLN